MSEQIIRTFQHLYRLIRIYSAVGLIGLFIPLLYGFLSSYPQAAIWSIVVIGSLFFISKVLLVLKRRESVREQHYYEDLYWLAPTMPPRSLLLYLNRPPAVPRFVFFLLLPAKDKELVLLDLHEIYVTRLLRVARIPVFKTKLQADLWYWGELFRSIVPLIIWHFRLGLTETSYRPKISENVKDVLPFYRRAT